MLHVIAQMDWSVMLGLGSLMASFLLSLTGLVRHLSLARSK